MEVDIEELAKLLYPADNDMPADHEDFQDYIVYLSSCGVEKLSRESSHLKEERNQVLEETKDMVYKNYKTFIHSADCSQTIFREFSNVEDRLEKLICTLPSLKSKVEEFVTTSRSLSQSRHTTSQTLAKHTHLLEILELPQLMETCVKNCYYEDALEILAYVRRLEKKHSDIPIIASIVSEVKGGTRLMLLQLLFQLRSSLTLPQCLKIVGLLRRLNVFSNSELKLKFLQARDSWFSSIIKSIPKDDAFQHISKIVEVSRVHLFDIVTQYRAIFSDEDSRFGISEGDINEQAIFHGWIIHKVNQFLTILEKDLQRGVGSNLESLLDQCMFFGQSFSRIGADFRNLLIPVFQNAAYARFESDVRSANLKFDESLSSFSLMESTQLKASSLLSESQDKTKPPLSLMEFAPLAHYMNGLVIAFNNLRQCCPLALLKKVLLVLSSSVRKVVTALADLHKMEASGFTSNEAKSFSRLCFLLSSALIPHINDCLRFLFPLQTVSSVSGIPLAELQKQGTGQLDGEKLFDPLCTFIPKKSISEINEPTLVSEETAGSNITAIPESEENIISDDTTTTTEGNVIEEEVIIDTTQENEGVENYELGQNVPDVPYDTSV